MGRRVRHLNPGSAGAVLALDSRFIRGLSDGDPVSTWSDRSGQGNDATSSGTARPTFETAEQGGQAVTRFDGIDDQLATSSPVTTVTDNWAMFSVAYTRSGARVHFSNGPDNGYAQTHSAGGFGVLYGGVVLIANSTPELNNWIVQTSTRISGSLTVLKNGIQIQGLTSTTNPNTPTTATYLGTDTVGYQNCDIAMASIFDIQILNPLRKRLEHAAAFSFKIACN